MKISLSEFEQQLELLKTNTTLQQIEAAEKYLAKLYPDQFISLYDKEIRSFIENNVGRA